MPQQVSHVVGLTQPLLPTVPVLLLYTNTPTVRQECNATQTKRKDRNAAVHMTFESNMAQTRPPELTESGVTNTQPDPPTTCQSGLCRPAMSASSKCILNQVAPLVIIPDCSLGGDGSSAVYSPGYMYEVDPLERTSMMLSPSATDLSSPVYATDRWEGMGEMEESMDLRSYNASPIWSQLDGPPIQDYLEDIKSITEINALRNELAALASPVKPVVGADVVVGVALEDQVQGLKDRGPTLAQLNDGESVLDRNACSTWVPQTEPVTAAGWKPTTTWAASFTTPAVATATKASTLPALPNSNEKRVNLAALLIANPPSQTLQRQLKTPTDNAPLSSKLENLLLLAKSDTPAANPTTTPKAPQRKRKRSNSSDQDSAASSSSMERKWEEIREFINDENAQQGVKVTGVKATGIKIADIKPSDETSTELPLMKKIKVEPEDPVERRISFSEDVMVKEECESDYEYHSDDDLSDVDSDCSYTSFIEEIRHQTKKDKKFFWQYNTQSKGPKGKRLCKSMPERDPHCLADFEDPVFQPECHDARYKHNGKARKGDGNDITPSPWKLFQIGNELLKLNKKINGIGNTNAPVRTKDGVKSKSRREKNKFASRACRLKKKAQHEANKLKLFGLEEEHRQLMEVLQEMKRTIYPRVSNGTISGDGSFVTMYDQLVKKHLTVMIAGNTADYVNTVLGRVADGDRSGAIFTKRQKSFST